MRLRLASLLIALLLTLSGCWVGAKSQDIPVQDLVPTHRQQRTLMVINQALEHYDYRKVSLNDDFAEKILEQYIKALDPNRSYFFQGDIDRFKRGVDRLDDDLARGKLDTALEIFASIAGAPTSELGLPFRYSTRGSTSIARRATASTAPRRSTPRHPPSWTKFGASA